MLSSLLSSVQLNQLHIPDRFWPTNSKKGVIGISSAATLVTLLTILYRRSKVRGNTENDSIVRKNSNVDTPFNY